MPNIDDTIGNGLDPLTNIGEITGPTTGVGDVIDNSPNASTNNNTNYRIGGYLELLPITEGVSTDSFKYNKIKIALKVPGYSDSVVSDENGEVSLVGFEASKSTGGTFSTVSLKLKATYSDNGWFYDNSTLKYVITLGAKLKTNSVITRNWSTIPQKLEHNMGKEIRFSLQNSVSFIPTNLAISTTGNGLYYDNITTSFTFNFLSFDFSNMSIYFRGSQGYISGYCTVYASNNVEYIGSDPEFELNATIYQSGISPIIVSKQVWKNNFSKIQGKNGHRFDVKTGEGDNILFSPKVIPDTHGTDGLYLVVTLKSNPLSGTYETFIMVE